MPQGSSYDENGNKIWDFDICTEFDCNVEYANNKSCDCKGDFTKEPCLFLEEHRVLNNLIDVAHEKLQEKGGE